MEVTGRLHLVSTRIITQVLALGSTDQNQFPQYAEEITQLLNGLEITNTTQQSSANREGILPAPGFLKLTPKVAVSYNPKLWEPEELNSDHYHFRYISDASGAFASIGTDEVPLVTTDGLPVPLENLTDFWAAAARQNGYPPSNRLQREAQG